MPFGWLFGRKKKRKGMGQPPNREYTLQTMAVGYLVDYDMETWQVVEYSVYDYEGGYRTEEWVLRSSSDAIRFLERSVEYTKNYWTLTETLSFDIIEEDAIAILLSDDQELNELTVDGARFVFTESGNGRARVNGEGTGRHFVAHNFEGPEGTVLFIMQWGDRDFDLVGGEYVEEYQFTNILPGRLTENGS
ncbi:MAG: DUF4178 domain-containing protein [Planctomycetota bacterium]|nr:DUF4178 domain-containing protein [Planctomycetota bacterium]MDA1137347.1 DUF4178 domain-containing protein [Planctomycetota bacterium]